MEPFKRLTILRWLSACLLIAGTVQAAPHGDLGQIETIRQFWFGMGVMGAGFALSWMLPTVPAHWFWGVALLSRLLLLPMTPSNDIWRYLWEGYIQTQGFSPYHLAPNAPELIPYHTDWWWRINHLDVSAIYPPLTQLGFRWLAAIAPSILLFKLAFVLADVWVCWLLSRRFGYARSLLYAWNPLIIYSFAGGAHYDSWFILPLVAAWLIVDTPTAARPNHAWVWSALLVGISAAVKWMSLPILGFLVWRSLVQRHVQRAVISLLCGLLPMLLSVIPFCDRSTCPLIPTESVFVSYGRSAEFIPHLVAQVWQPSLQANWIYLFPLSLFLLWLVIRSTSFLQFTLWYFFGLLTLTPIIHGWYFTWIVPFAVPGSNWGVRLVSLSAFVYFVLLSRASDWRLMDDERLLLWLPFVLGWLWTVWRESQTKFNKLSAIP